MGLQHFHTDIAFHSLAFGFAQPLVAGRGEDMKMNHHFNVWDNVAGIHGSIAALTRSFLDSLQGFKSTDARDQVVAL